MKVTAPLVTAHRSGAAAYAPLPQEEVLHRLPTWRHGHPFLQHSVRTIATLRGSWALASTPQAYEILQQTFSLEEYARRTLTFATPLGQVAYWALFLLVTLLTCAGATWSLIFHPWPSGGLLWESILVAVTIVSAVGTTCFVMQGVDTLRLRRLLTGPHGAEVATEWASLQAAQEALPSSPLPRLYEAWQRASTLEEREGLEAAWREVVAREEEEQRARLHLPASAPRVVPLPEALTPEERRRQGHAKGLALATLDALLPLGEGSSPAASPVPYPQDEVRR